MARFNDDDFYAIRDWALDGCICVRSELTYRYQKSYPNTFCLIWTRPQIPRFIGQGAWCAAWACLDVHYSSKGNFEALGGFWINGIKDQELKPQQEFWRDGGECSRQAYQALKAIVPARAPQSEDHVTYDTHLTSLRAHDAVMKSLLGG